jgi:hypothetical protein
MEPRPVDVLHDGRWLPGWLLAALQDPGGPFGGGWFGTPRRRGCKYYHWRDESELRRTGPLGLFGHPVGARLAGEPGSVVMGSRPPRIGSD